MHYARVIAPIRRGRSTLPAIDRATRLNLRRRRLSSATPNACGAFLRRRGGGKEKHLTHDFRLTDPETGVASGLPGAAICVQDIDVQCVLQFTLIHAAGCALHRHTSRVIHRLELSIQFYNNNNAITQLNSSEKRGVHIAGDRPQEDDDSLNLAEEDCFRSVIVAEKEVASLRGGGGLPAYLSPRRDRQAARSVATDT